MAEWSGVSVDVPQLAMLRAVWWFVLPSLGESVLPWQGNRFVRAFRLRESLFAMPSGVSRRRGLAARLGV